jgi:hypothetical protein
LCPWNIGDGVQLGVATDAPAWRLSKIGGQHLIGPHLCSKAPACASVGPAAKASYSEAKRFFELSDWQLHEIACSCHTGATMQAGWAAGGVVRGIVNGSKILAWLRKDSWRTEYCACA